MDEIRKQQVIDEKVFDQKLMADTVRKLAWDGTQKKKVTVGDIMINIRTGEALSHEVDYTRW